VKIKIVSFAAAAILLLSSCSALFGNFRDDLDTQNSIYSSDLSRTTETSSPEDVASLTKEISYSEGVAEELEENTVSITIPEGYTLARIAMLLEEKGLCTVDEFIDEAQSGKYHKIYSLLLEQELNNSRCFALEGYLFPDTYEFYKNASLEDIINSFLANTERKITEDLRTQISVSAYTVDQIITMASIIEKESQGEEIMPIISSIFHNRLDSGMKLQSDVTIKYVEGAVKPFISGDINRYNEHYNTYKCDRLPAGAICNPGIKAILAALNPARTDYFFFVTDKETQEYYFASTYEEHLQNVDLAGWAKSD
jgi:UPF0755 protein